MSFSYSIVIDEIDTCGSFNDIHTVSLYNDTITTGKFPTKTLHSHAFPLQLNNMVTNLLKCIVWFWFCPALSPPTSTGVDRLFSPFTKHLCQFF